MVTTINKELNAQDNAEKILIEFINLIDENNLSTRTRFVSKGEYASSVIKAVNRKMKSL